MCDYVRLVECATNDNAIKIKGRQIKSTTNINKMYTQYKSCEFAAVAAPDVHCSRQFGLRFSDVCVFRKHGKSTHSTKHTIRGWAIRAIWHFIFLFAVSQTVEKVN